MRHPLPEHPYEAGTRVHQVTDVSPLAFVHGTAELLHAQHEGYGVYRYLVRTDEGDKQSWPSYFTIVAGTWSALVPEERLVESGAAPPSDDGATPVATSEDDTSDGAAERLADVADPESAA